MGAKSERFSNQQLDYAVNIALGGKRYKDRNRDESRQG